MTTIKQVARHAGVSVGTVSNVLSGSVSVSPELRRRVTEAIRELDYHPNYVARSLRVKDTKTLGMVISDITNPFFPQVVRGAEDAAFAHDYLLNTFNTDDRLERERQVLALLRYRRVDGLLLVVAPNNGDIDHIRRTLDAGIPIVCLDRIPAGIALDSVSVDNVKGAQMCVQHLIMRGHTRIAIVTGSLALQTAQDRLKGYELALEEAGIQRDAELVYEGDFREETGYRIGKGLLLRHRRPSAVFVSNGMMTIGFLQALEEVGLSCPDDVALATFDDLPVAAVFRPHLTSVAQPGYQIGYRGADLLIERLQQKISGRKKINILLEPELRIRESTGQPLKARPIRAQAGRSRR
ncbi:MAG TPA: LacI family DNA-binding transcriptional regulator [Bryobacteraceae bacterium]|jgi:LacI family transcriptional regulator|nr:LacI family DNA-binding transcriptional regulator [Bryobacteraceae bacterium]